MATTIQKLLFVDTNIWLDFYRAQNEAYLGLLEKVEALKPKIIVTHQLETEYKKSRQAVIIASIDLLQAHRLKKVPSVGVLAQAKQFKMLGQDIDKANERIKKLQDRLIAMLAEPSKKDKVYQAVHRVFHRTDDLVLTRKDKDSDKRKSIRERAERRFMHGCPPRKKDDTSYGDAVNWEWMIDCAISKDAELVIVSRDADYGSTYDKKSYINDHLRQEFSNRVSQKRKLLLYTRLSDALKQFKVTVTAEQVKAETELIDFDEPHTVADPNDFEIVQTHPIAI